MPLRNYEDRKYCMDIPVGVSMLLLVQAFERLAFHGVRVTLTIYMFDRFLYSSKVIVLIYHLFHTLVFLSASLALPAGKIIQCGKFVTSITVFIPYIIGLVLLLFSSMYDDHPYKHTFFLTSLPLIAIGGGFFYTCTSLMIVEQNDIENEVDDTFRNAVLCNFLGLVWMFTARVLVPEIQTVVVCFGAECYLASVIMIASCAGLAAVLFIILGFTYVELKGSSERKFFRVFWLGACKNCWKFPKSRAKYLNDNVQGFSDEDLENIESFWDSAMCFAQLAVFWSYCCQQGSTWTLQATELNSFLSFLDITPGQIQLFFPVFFLFLAPFQEFFILPLLRKMGINKTHHRQFIGSIFSVLAAVGAWILQEYIVVTKEGIFAGSETSKSKEYFMEQDQSSLQLLSILWQIPQYFCLTFAAVIFLSTAFEVPYVKLTGNYQDLGVMICFLSLSCGEALTGLSYFILAVDKKTWFMINAIYQGVACVLFRVIALFQDLKRK